MEPKGLIKLKIVCPLLLCFASIVLFASKVGAVSVDDSFIAGYATAVLEREFNLTASSLSLKDGVITMRAEELEGTNRDEVITSLSCIQGVVRVQVMEPGQQATNGASALAPQLSSATPKGEQGEAENSASNRVILPKGKLFDPLIADPRWPHFSATYQYYIDDEELRNVGATSFGETLGLYRDDAPFGGQWQLGIQAAVFAIFDLDAHSYDLVNADYWVGIPISYRDEALSALLRVFHQSSHIGDEYLLRNRVDRVNLSYEGVDVKLSYDLDQWVRVYAGGGYLFHRVPSNLDPWSTQFGFELKSPWTYLGGVVRPVAGADFKNVEENDWNTDVSLRVGIQLESARTIGHKVQLMLQYFNGYSPNGQFYERSIEYIGIGAHFYF